MVRVLSLRLLYQLIGALATLVYGTLTARWLGPSDKGLVSLILLIAYMASLLGGLGANEALAYLRNRRGFTAAEIFAGLAALTLGWGGILAIGTTVVVHVWGPVWWHVGFPWWLAAATGTLVLLRLWLQLGRSQLLAEGRFGLANGLDVAFVLLPLGLLFPLTVWGGANVLTVVGGALLATLAVVIATTVAAFGYRGRASLARLAALAQESLRYSLRTFARIIGATLLYRVNVFLVGALLDMRSVGWYAIALMFSEVLLKIPDAVTWLLTPQVSRAKEGEVNGMTARYLRWTLAVSLGLAVVAAAVIPWFVPLLLTRAYAPAVLPSLLLLPGGLFAVVYQLLSSSLTGRGKAGQSIAATWLGVAAMVVFNLVAIPRWGLVGAAASASLAYGVAAAALIWAYCRATGGGTREMFLPQPGDRVVIQQGMLAIRRRLWARS